MGQRGPVVLGLTVLLVVAGCAEAAEQSVETLGEAQTSATQIRLQQASGVAGNYFATNGSYSGFNAAVARSFEPSIRWTDGGPPSPDGISIRGVTATSLVLVSSDPGGRVYCIGQTNGLDSMGTVDADTAAECSGGW